MLLSLLSVIQIIQKKIYFKFIFILKEVDKGTVLPILGGTVNCSSKNLQPDFKDIKEIKLKRLCHLICITQGSWLIENNHIYINICILQKLILYYKGRLPLCIFFCK